MLGNDKTLMVQTIETLISPMQVFEVRGLDVQGYGNRLETWSGFFQFNGTNAIAIVQEIMKLKPAAGIYLTLNPVNPTLLALGFNRMARSQSGKATGDKDITQRRWLPIDIDPVRKSGTSAENQLVQLAQQKAVEVMDYLRSLEFAEPVVAFSGNGFHLLYPVDLPREDNGLVQQCLESLAQQFDSPEVKIDTAVFNPARIMRLYGSVARKGDEVPQLKIHHRLSKILKVPSTL
jgi:hypothetical protein